VDEPLHRVPDEIRGPLAELQWVVATVEDLLESLAARPVSVTN
jgi:hypothetical protein